MATPTTITTPTAPAPAKKTARKAPAKKTAPAPVKKTAPVKSAPAPAKKTTRKAQAIAWAQRKRGVTAAELNEAFEWLTKTTRGFFATLHTQHGMNVETELNKNGETVYHIS